MMAGAITAIAAISGPVANTTGSTEIGAIIAVMTITARITVTVATMRIATIAMAAITNRAG
jgi:hypothetical protein